MTHIFNVTAIRDLMQDPPKAQRLHHFFNSDPRGRLTEEQVSDVIDIITKQTEYALKAINLPEKTE